MICGMETVSLRYFNVYPVTHRTVCSCYRILETKFEGKPLTIIGDGTNRNFIHVADVAQI